MFHITRPHPKYKLNRYSTRQLYAWLEESVLVEEIRYKENVNVYPIPGDGWEGIMAARRMRYAILDVLREREEPIGKAVRKMRNVKEDVWS